MKKHDRSLRGRKAAVAIQRIYGIASLLMLLAMTNISACGGGNAGTEGCTGPDCGINPPPPAIVDADSDSVSDFIDNCLNVANADQADADKDMVGDACDSCDEESEQFCKKDNGEAIDADNGGCIGWVWGKNEDGSFWEESYNFCTNACDGKVDGCGVKKTAGTGAIGNKQPIVKDWMPNAMPIDESSKCFSDDIPADGQVGPVSLPLKDTDFKEVIFYVDGQSSLGGDGSKKSPFRTIGEALQANKVRNVKKIILVAGGDYNEDLIIEAGDTLYGGFKSQTWERDFASSASVIRNQKGSLAVKKGTVDDKTIIDGFTIYAASKDAIVPDMGTKLILRNNTIYIDLAAVTDDMNNSSDDYYGRVLGSSHISLHAHHNRILVPYDKPETVMSTGFALYQSCYVIANNHFVDLRTSIMSYSSDKGAFINNIIENGYNGIATYQEKIRVENNTIAVHEGEIGCGYAVYIAENLVYENPPSNPSIIDNVIILQGSRAKGINESYNGGDPAVLTGNHFVLAGTSTDNLKQYVIYHDYDDKKSENVLKEIEKVNAMTDISEIGSNTLEEVILP